MFISIRSAIRLFYLLVLIACGSMFAIADNGAKLSGRVLDANGGVLAGANLQLSSKAGLQLSTVTDKDGAYSFDRLSAGDYVLEVQANSFSSSVQQFELDAGQEKTLDVTLQVGSVDEQVIVTAAGAPQSIDEISKSVSVVDSQQIEHRSDVSISAALRNVPGLRVEQLGGPGAFTKILTRGLRTADTSFLVDGIRIRDAADFSGSINPFLEDMLTNNIDRAEVLRGSGSSLYGTNAVGGVVNLVPQEGAGHPRVTLGFEGGGLGQFRERASISGGVREKLSYSFGATRYDVNDGVHGDDVYRNTSVGGHVRYNIRPNMSLRGTFTFSDGFSRLDDSPFPIGPANNPFGYALGTGPVVGFVENATNPDSFRFANFFSGSVAFSHQVSNVYSYQVSYQGVVTNRFFTNGPGESAPEIQYGIFEFEGDSTINGRINTINFTNNIRAGRHNLITAGFEFEHESFTQEFVSPFFSNPRTTDKQNTVAFFAQDQINALDGRLYMMMAFRSQAFIINNPGSVPQVANIEVKRAYTGDGSISYRITPNTKLRSHVGNSFRAPSLSERFVFFQGQRIGNPFLQPERGISVDGGIDQTFASNKVRLGATYFYTRLQQIITSKALFHETNGKGALSRGVELTMDATPYRTMKLNTSYTLASSQQTLGFPILTSDNTTIPAGQSFQSLSIPKHTFNFEANQSFKHGINVNFNIYAVSKHNFTLFDPIFFSEVLFSFKGYSKAGLTGSYTRNIGESKQMTLYVKVDNLFNQVIVDEGFRNPGAVGLGGIKFRF